MSMKDDFLKKNGSFNKNYENVTADIFNKSPFFDKKDNIQVKYEMLRAVSKEEGTITELTGAYGFSRNSYYQLDKAFKNAGIYALFPKKTGPKGASKLTPEVSDFIESFLANNNNAKAKDISTALKAEMRINIHTRTIYRHLKKNRFLP